MNMDHTKSEIVELSDAELDMVDGGNIFGDIGRAILGAIEAVGSFIVSGFQGGPPTNNPWRGPFQPHGGPGTPPA